VLSKKNSSRGQKMAGSPAFGRFILIRIQVGLPVVEHVLVAPSLRDVAVSKKITMFTRTGLLPPFFPCMVGASSSVFASSMFLIFSDFFPRFLAQTTRVQGETGLAPAAEAMPEAPRWVLYIFLAVLGGLLVGAVIAAWIQHLRLNPRTAEEFADLRDRADDLRRRLAEQSQENAALSAHYEGLRDQHKTLLEESREQEDQLLTLERENSRLSEKNVHLLERLENEKREITRVQEQMRAQFSELANETLQKTTRIFTGQNRENLDQVLEPYRDTLQEFRARLDAIYGDYQKNSGALNKELENLRGLNTQLSEDAQNLSEALRGQNKLLGNWGELMLRKTLELSGLRLNFEYKLQPTLREEKPGDSRAKIKRPDVVVYYPEQKGMLFIDSKVSLLNYTRYCNTKDDAEREREARKVIESFRAHIKGLGDKNYAGVVEDQSPDFVLMFVPVEGALSVAQQYDPEIVSYALESGVVIVTPWTLLAAMRLISQTWRQHQQIESVRDIVERATFLYEKFELFYRSFTEIGQSLDNARAAFDTADNRLKTGQGNLAWQIKTLEEMGIAPRKKLNIPEATQDWFLDGETQEAQEPAKRQVGKNQEKENEEKEKEDEDEDEEKEDKDS
jgi:DNA recombination protein RmuC